MNSQGTNTTPTTYLTFSSGDSGDVELDFANGGYDPDTTVIIDGVEMNFSVEFSGTLPQINKLSNVYGEDVRGEEIVVITAEDGQRYYFLTDGSGTYALMNAMPNGALPIDNVSTAGPVLVCFAEGTLIDTINGPRPVERLRQGDQIMVDGGLAAPLRWVGQRRVSSCEQLFRRELRPIVIPKNCFGPGLPIRDLRVSRQHRIVLDGWQVEMHFGCDRVLAAAGHMILAGATVDHTCRPVTFFHLLFDRHEIIRSEGLPTESFNPGKRASLGLHSDMLSGLKQAKPEFEAAQAAIWQDALPCLNRLETGLLASHVAQTAFPESLRAA